MKNAGPIFDTATPYRIELQGQVDVDWLQSFDSSVEISVEQTGQMDEITVLNVHTDQSGIVGLVRRLHGLGIPILRFQIIAARGEAAEVEE